MNDSVSVVIATRNRPDQIKLCLNKLLKSATKPLEIIIVDQSNNQETKKIVLKSVNKLIKYFHLNSKGKSKSINLAIKKANGDLIAFTDDDCLVNKNWISNIQKTFKKHKNISLCFGKTLPYQPEQHKQETCPCTFEKGSRFSITKKPGEHWDNIGFGNNMIVKKNVFQRVGGFKEWLGPGSIGSNAEDAEMINRCLIKGYKIGYEPSILVSHNKWLNKNQMSTQNWSYDCGGMACYSWFALSGFKFAKKIVRDILKDAFQNITWNKLTAHVWGLLVAITTHFKNHIQKK